MSTTRRCTNVARRAVDGVSKAMKAGKPWKKPSSEKGTHYKISKAQLEVIHQMKADNEPTTLIAKATCLSRPTIYKVLRQQPEKVLKGRRDQC